VLTALVLSFGLLTPAMSVNAAGSGTQTEEALQTVTGPFDGLDLKAGRIWINDMVYLLDIRVRVKGTASKLGLITDLKSGETIKATIRENLEQPTIPIVTLIERQ